MTLSQAALAEIRYGYGFRPDRKPVPGANALLAGLKKADPYLKDHPAATIAERFAYRRQQIAANKAFRAKEPNGKAMAKAARQTRDKMYFQDFRLIFSRPVLAQVPFRERLLAFWSDHFTVAVNSHIDSLLVLDYQQHAIRPHVTGKFSDMLEAVVTHPSMLLYLGQANSIGPNSVAGERRKAGLNENLAREVLELHTLGVSAGYTQQDVREFAELLTGLTNGKEGFRFAQRFAEPGAETVLGKNYGGDKDDLGAIRQALRDISMREETAYHLARKLSVHFIGGEPVDSHVKAVAEAYLASGGDLMATYTAFLDHEAAWVPELRKAKQPFDFIVSSLRAVNLKPKHFKQFKLKDYRRNFIEPLTSMGQPWARANGPNGWSEDAEDWITPAGLTARIHWANALAQRHAQSSDPRRFLKDALRDVASDDLTLAVSRAETKHEGIAITLASPEFNRR
ncbi:DUF1800 domain-containing protein [Algicella marina]|uniref:DUF1800 family protein n=1 Tax=Algicella marina TaxID=2683284 RepID=A0A6P1T2V6_9RHOB|nr:DUF1800 domain-containing protein [Algicella marina]QHQ36085.1 DUF1800 family protein [Algicella marina]